MGKQDIFIRVEQVLDATIGNEGEDLRNYFNVPYEDDLEDCNDINEIGHKIYEPIANIDDAIKELNEAKEKGANFISIWSHEDHQEIRIEGFRITKLTDEEVKLKKEAEEAKKAKLALQEQEELAEFERLKQKLGR